MNPIISTLKDKNVIILGFGREGRSSYHWMRKHLPLQPLTIADKHPIELNFNDPNITLICGDEYMNNLNNYDLIIKSPGVPFAKLNYYVEDQKISSQTALFLQHYGHQTIGITGTKGKSTTASLLFHIINKCKGNAFLVGNIGIPFFDIIDEIDSNSTIVAELSALQLEFVRNSPHIAIMLNLFKEHLDFFNTFNNYINAKMNITQYQSSSNYFIYNYDDDLIGKQLHANNYKRNYLSYSRVRPLNSGAFTREQNMVIIQAKTEKGQVPISVLHNLRGGHNVGNAMAALLACDVLHLNLNEVAQYMQEFVGLEHRLEKVGKINGITFFNDSISTVPESTISALQCIDDVATLILGGFDRGIDYTIIYKYLADNPVQHLIFTGPAGERMLKEMKEKQMIPPHIYQEEDYKNIIMIALHHTPKGKVCLLSPAAASYNAFQNFEERGNYFKQLLDDYKTRNC